MRKVFWILLIIISVILVSMLVLGIVSKFQASTKPPAVAEAPYSVITEGPVYLMKSYDDMADAVILHSYWGYLDGRWVYSDGDMILNKSAYLRLEVKRR